MKTLKRRRKENKTDYFKRLKLLKSGKPRIIFRKTNRYIIGQYITSEEAKDKIIMGITSKELIKYGWPSKLLGSLKSIPASYLTGYLIGKKIKKIKLENPILDSGMINMVDKSKIYSFIKGLIDSGIDLKCPEKLFPEEDVIVGNKLKNNFSEYFKKIKLNIEKI
jgi:large subunit ribosomal protein L18